MPSSPSPLVVVAIGLVVWNSNIIQRGTTAVTVEGESYSAAEVSYYYHNAYNSIVNSNYVSLYGIDKNTAPVSAEPERHRQDDVACQRGHDLGRLLP